MNLFGGCAKNPEMKRQWETGVRVAADTASSHLGGLGQSAQCQSLEDSLTVAFRRHIQHLRHGLPARGLCLPVLCESAQFGQHPRYELGSFLRG